ncbi:MAG: MCE family protein [Deltaproteobacteria bacterium]|nr:MCE family protein [Deltaproteobacteria bacterium]
MANIPLSANFSTVRPSPNEPEQRIRADAITMANARTKVLVGLFVASGLGISIVSILVLGMNNFFQHGNKYQIFFNESVQGLNVDAPVKFRGVPAGLVRSIELAPDGTLVQVVLDVGQNVRLPENTVAQLSAVGITGAMFIELDSGRPSGRYFKPPSDMQLEYDYPVLATRQSSIQQFMEGVDELYGKINAIDFEGISSRIVALLDHADQAVLDIRAAELSTQVQTAIHKVNNLLHDPRLSNFLNHADQAGRQANAILSEMEDGMVAVREIVDKVSDTVGVSGVLIEESLKDIRASARRSDVLLAQGQEVFRQSRENLDSTERSILVTVQNLERSSEALTRLLQKLETYPAQLLFGQPPAPRTIEP